MYNDIFPLLTETNEEEKGWDAPRVTRILTHDFPQYFAVISRIRQEVHAIGPEGNIKLYQIENINEPTFKRNNNFIDGM